jgi:hypothetical protein
MEFRKKNKKIKIVISRNELLKYAAHPIRYIIKKSKLEIILIKLKLQIKNLVNTLNKNILCVKGHKFKWSDLGLEIPDIFFQARWYNKIS